jgi:hypothetical protein
MLQRSAILMAAVVSAVIGLTACGGTSKTTAPSNKNAAGVRARMYEASRYVKAKNYAAVCALETQASQHELIAELKMSSCVAAQVKLDEPLPPVAGFSLTEQRATEAKARAEGYAELAERKIVVVGDKATVTLPKVGWTKEYVYRHGQWLLAKTDNHGETYEATEKRYQAETRSAQKLLQREMAEYRTAGARHATEERGNQAKEAAQQRQQAKEAATARVAEEAKKAEVAAADSAKKLVEVWKEEPVEASDENVLSIQRHLISLGSKCEQSIPTLANVIYATVEILKKAGISETPASIAAAFDMAAPGKKITAECKSILSALTVLIERGEG